MQKKRLYKICAFVLALFVFVGITSLDVDAIGYTYNHKGKVIYSTDGFTVNQTPYIYSNLGLDEIADLSNPKDLFVYRDPRDNDKTTVYLLNGVYKASDAARSSTLYALDENL